MKEASSFLFFLILFLVCLRISLEFLLVVFELNVKLEEESSASFSIEVSFILKLFAFISQPEKYASGI